MAVEMVVLGNATGKGIANYRQEEAISSSCCAQIIAEESCRSS